MEIQYEHRFTELEESCKSAHKRIDELHEAQNNMNELISSVSTLATNQGNMKEKLDKVSENVEIIMMQPAKRWDAVVTAIIGAVAGIIVGLIFAGN